jgi:hypothetical protein
MAELMKQRKEEYNVKIQEFTTIVLMHKRVLHLNP